MDDRSTRDETTESPRRSEEVRADPPSGAALDVVAPVGNRAFARAVTGLSADLPPGRGLIADRDVLARRLARTVGIRRTLMRDPVEVATTQGKFNVSLYDPVDTGSGDEQKKVGLNIDVTFASPSTLRSSKIGFVQIMKVLKNGTPYLFANESPRATGAAAGEAGWTVDRLKGKTQGFYGMSDDGSNANNFRAGNRTDDTTSSDAYMRDRVSLSRAPGMTMDCSATTFAIDIEHGTYLSGFSWGFSCAADGTVTLKAPAEAAFGDIQKAAIEGWNKQAALDDDSKRNADDQQTLPTPWAAAAPAKKRPWWKPRWWK